MMSKLNFEWGEINNGQNAKQMCLSCSLSCAMTENLRKGGGPFYQHVPSYVQSNLNQGMLYSIDRHHKGAV